MWTLIRSIKQKAVSLHTLYDIRIRRSVTFCFYELLGEKEFKYFTDKDYEALDGVLDDTLAEMLQTYLDNDASDAVVKEIQHS